MWRSPRQLLRASKAKNGSATGGGKQRTICDLTKQESTIGGQQKHAFGRTTMDTVRFGAVHRGERALIVWW